MIINAVELSIATDHCVSEGIILALYYEIRGSGKRPSQATSMRRSHVVI